MQRAAGHTGKTGTDHSLQILFIFSPVARHISGTVLGPRSEGGNVLMALE
jgi:hypothetical protein